MLGIFSNFVQILTAILGLGILVFFHELGHYIAAIIFKIKVEKFSIGMGPALYKVEKNNTVFQIGAVPFGGFCKFKGDELTDDINVARDDDSFYSAHPAKRFVVAFSGPFMNYIIAILFLSILAMWSHKANYSPNQILLVDDIRPVKDGLQNPATLAGLQSQDIIYKINDVEVNTFSDISEYFLLNQKPSHTLYVKRGDETLTMNIKPKWDPEQLKYIIGIYSYVKPVVKHDSESKFQKLLGLRDKDEIIGINDDYDNMAVVKVSFYIQENFSKDITGIFHIKRNNSIIDIPVNFNELCNKISYNEITLQFYYPERIIKGKNFLAAFTHGFFESNKIIRISVTGLYSLIFKPKKNVSKQLGGPIMIGYMIGKITVDGFKESFLLGLREFFSIISYISLLLAFFNLLPIPALDGGHIVMNIYELITKRPLNLKIVYLVNFVFFVIIILSAILIAYLDISKIVGNSF